MNADSETLFPRFSIILETENLASADVQGLARSLAALADQDLSPTCANEVILIDSGDTPAELLRQLCQIYPWITVHSAPPGTTYYQSKMLGAELATGEIVVYYDSDCLYQPNWLRLMLTPFGDDSSIQIVAGETTTGGSGPYGTAMALTYVFPQFSRQVNLVPTSEYFLNNVAFRRSLLLQCPILPELPLYRGNCVVHAYDLQQAGYRIWKQPQARVIHAPPNGLRHFFWRFLLIGHDQYWLKQLLSNRGRSLAKTISSGMSNEMSNEMSDKMPKSGWKTKGGIFRDRLQKMFQNHPRHLLYFPFAIPIMIAAVTLIFAGYLLTSLAPYGLLHRQSKEFLLF